MNRPPAPRTTSQELAAQVPTVPAQASVRVTSAEDLEAREKLADRKAARSRIAEVVALVTTVSVALAAITHEIGVIVQAVFASKGHCP